MALSYQCYSGKYY
jgi:hypothetical protein